MNSPHVAVVGSGIAGLTAAFALSRHPLGPHVTLFEADDRFGGHAHTHAIDDPMTGTRLWVDTGFIVHNDRTYPQLRRLLKDLGVRVHPTEMSMSIRCDGCGLEYAGGRGGAGVFAQRRNLVNPRFLRMLADVKRFQLAAGRLLDAADTDGGQVPTLTFGEFLRREHFSDFFVEHYAVPVVACVWSTGTDRVLEYPAGYLFEFLRNHGFLTVRDSPTWFTIAGGSHRYVEAVTAAIEDTRTGAAVTAVTRLPDGGVEVTDVHDNRQVFDAAVLATHPGQTLAMLTHPTDAELRTLGVFEYSANRVLLHRDASVLPRSPQARASWNYRMTSCGAGAEGGAPVVSYWMNKLQGLSASQDYVVTLNDDSPSDVIAEIEYEHPVYTQRSVAAQRELAELDSGPIAFAGAWQGWGFHEDGCRSGLAAADRIAAGW